MMMMQCWEFDPDKRPSFSSLVDSLSQSLEGMANYMDIGNSLSESNLAEKHAVNSGKELPAANDVDKPFSGKSEENPDHRVEFTAQSESVCYRNKC